MVLLTGIVLCEDEAARVKYVKTQHSFVLENPIVLYKKVTIKGGQKRHKRKKGVSGILLEDSRARVLAGILSHRDVLSDEKIATWFRSL